MDKYRTLTRMAVFSLVCGFACMFLWDCSGTGDTRGFFTFWRSQLPVTRPTDKEISDFVSLTRPPQGNADAHYNLGRYLVEKGKYGKALVEFKKAAAIRPESVLAYNGLGVCYDNLGEFQKAMEAYEMALKLNPNLDYVQYNIGCSLFLQEKYDKAIEAFRKAIVLNDQKPHYHNNLAKTYAMVGEYDLAFREFELGGKIQTTQKAVAERNVQTADSEAAAAHQKQEAASMPHSVGNDHPAKGNVELLNGNGVTGMARKMRAYLMERGFNVVRCANADNFNYSRTTVHYRREGSEAAQQLLSQIPDIKNVKEVKRLDRPDATVKMVMGKDLKHFKSQLEGEP